MAKFVGADQFGGFGQLDGSEHAQREARLLGMTTRRMALRQTVDVLAQFRDLECGGARVAFVEEQEIEDEVGLQGEFRLCAQTVG